MNLPYLIFKLLINRIKKTLNIKTFIIIKFSIKKKKVIKMIKSKYKI